ncbi:MAG: hypothetical protein FJ298_05215 [Planctomycetes bacterium]|nr:hypothetical protein [Planctomycetota bacterium]
MRPREFALALCLAGLPSACRCPDAAALLAARRDSPRATVEAFQRFLDARLYEQEYGCLSTGFRREHGLSLFGYSEFRDRLQRERPWFGALAGASIEHERSLGPAEHAVELAALGQRLRVRLVREDFYRIRSAQSYCDGRADLGTMVRVESDLEGGAAWVLRLPREAAETSVNDLTSVTLERLWLIDGVDLVESP